MCNSSSQMFHIPRAVPAIRLLATALGLLIFLWLTPEDNQVWPVAALGAGLSMLAGGMIVLRHFGGQTIPARCVPLGAALLGALVGLGASLAVTGLMFFKNALHAHLFLDYPVSMMLSVLGRAPGWAVAGSFVGLAAALAWLAVKRL
jgi:hypothetical protein